VWGSFSFGNPRNLSKTQEVFREAGPGGQVIAVCLTEQSGGNSRYCPEIGLRDAILKEDGVCTIYAYYARDWSVPMLTRLYTQLFKKHNIDTAIVIDGGSDSLMSGDEQGLGDPIEDSVSVTTIALMPDTVVKTKLLLTVGFGLDRFNDVTDFDGMASIQRLKAKGGFLGSVSIEPTSPAFQFYQSSVDRIYGGQSFRSVLTGGIISASQGAFDFVIPAGLEQRVTDGSLFLWPLTAMIWAFDPVVVAAHSVTSHAIRDQEFYVQADAALEALRAKLRTQGLIKSVVNLPG